MRPQLLGLGDSEAATVGYGRVSSHQSADLARQQEVLETYCAAKGDMRRSVRNLGSKINYHKAGLLKRVEMILNRRMRRLVITHKGTPAAWRGTGVRAVQAPLISLAILSIRRL